MRLASSSLPSKQCSAACLSARARSYGNDEAGRRGHHSTRIIPIFFVPSSAFSEQAPNKSRTRQQQTGKKAIEEKTAAGLFVYPVLCLAMTGMLAKTGKPGIHGLSVSSRQLPTKYCLTGQRSFGVFFLVSFAAVNHFFHH
jgi:hypothetical protein